VWTRLYSNTVHTWAFMLHYSYVTAECSSVDKTLQQHRPHLSIHVTLQLRYGRTLKCGQDFTATPSTLEHSCYITQLRYGRMLKCGQDFTATPSTLEHSCYITQLRYGRMFKCGQDFTATPSTLEHSCYITLLRYGRMLICGQGLVTS
jgi:ubiquitin